MDHFHVFMGVLSIFQVKNILLSYAADKNLPKFTKVYDSQYPDYCLHRYHFLSMTSVIIDYRYNLMQTFGSAPETLLNKTKKFLQKNNFLPVLQNSLPYIRY